ncbi:MAG: hypothetical protein WA705_28275 [Candidatus Ozemobacteraceae bacterium]
MKQRGTSLIEVTVAMLIISLLVLFLVELNRSSNRATMDAYYQLLACQLAHEPIEVFQCIGYRRLAAKEALPQDISKEFPIDTPVEMEPRPNVPQEIRFFKRLIHLQEVSEGGTKGYLITVSVSPSGENAAAAWLVKKSIEMHGLILDQPIL